MPYWMRVLRKTPTARLPVVSTTGSYSIVQVSYMTTSKQVSSTTFDCVCISKLGSPLYEHLMFLRLKSVFSFS